MLPPDVQIRAAVPADAEALLAYSKRIVDEPHNNMTRDPGQWPMTVEEERSFLEKQAVAPTKSVFLLAERGGEIVGSVLVQRHPAVTTEHAATIGISVAAGHRRQGIGRALMLAAIGWAKERGLRRLELKVFTRNAPAIALYESVGFVTEGLHRMASLKQGVWCHDLTMALLLDE